jgi:hypothetical protein
MFLPLWISRREKPDFKRQNRRKKKPKNAYCFQFYLRLISSCAKLLNHSRKYSKNALSLYQTVR